MLLVFSISMWAVNNEPEQGLGQKTAQIGHITDRFAVSYSKIMLDEFGQPKNKLYADFAAHYSDSAETELTKPQLIVKKGDLPPWIIRSNSGVITDDGQLLLMHGQVNIDRAGAESVREVNIETSNLRIEPKRSYAETDEWAELITGPDTISGVGMKLFYQEPLYIELLANVKGSHVYE